MARITKPLTNTEIERAKAREKDYTLSDGQGLYLLIKSNGSKLWRFNYYQPFSNPKKRILLGVGKYPEISLAQARAKRAEYLALLAQNVDPQMQRIQQAQEENAKQTNTFQKVAELWKEKKEHEIEPKTIKKYWASLNLHVLPFLGNYPVTQVLPAVVIPILKRVEEMGRFDMVHRLCQYINDIMRYAVNKGLITLNPCVDISDAFKRHKKKNNPRIEIKELPELLQKINKASIEKQTQILILFTLLTMTRTIESSGAKWSEIDLQNKLWTIPAERMKARKPHTVPLSTQAVKLLQELQQITGHCVYVFPKRGKEYEPMNPSSVNVALRRMGYGGKQTAHGMRGLSRTFLGEQGVRHEWAESCIAHSTGGSVSLAYNHATYLEQRKEIMQQWGDYVEQCSIVSTI